MKTATAGILSSFAIIDLLTPPVLGEICEFLFIKAINTCSGAKEKLAIAGLEEALHGQLDQSVFFINIV